MHVCIYRDNDDGALPYSVGNKVVNSKPTHCVQSLGSMYQSLNLSQCIVTLHAASIYTCNHLR